MTAAHPATPAARASARSYPRDVLLWLICLALAIVLLAGSIATSDQPAVSVVWGGLALAGYCAALLFLAGMRQGAGLSRWKLGSWILLWYGVTFGVTTVTFSQPQTGDAALIVLPSVLRALWLVGIGMTAWAAGYLAGPGRPAVRITARAMSSLGARYAGEVRGRWSPYALYAVGVAARLAATAVTGRLGYVGDAASAVSTSPSAYAGILGALSLCAPLGVAAAALQVFRERLPGTRITLAVLFCVELAFGAAAGNKESFVIAVLAVVIPFSATRRKLPKTAPLATIFVFLFIVIPFNQAYRGAARQGTVTLTPGQAVAAAPGILRQTVSGQSVRTVVPESVSYLMQRIREIDSPAIIVQRSPGQVPFVSPLQLVEGPVVDMVPRALWPGKPVLVGGYQFGQQYFGLPSTIYTSTPDTMIGGLYWHGGWIPVIAGMFLFGCCVRLLDDVLDVRANPHAAFLVLLLFGQLVGGEEDWQGVISAVPATLVVWLLAVAVTFRRRSLQERRANSR
jgi:hypothetical protein